MSPLDRWSFLRSGCGGQRCLAEQTEQTPSDGPEWTNGASEGRLSDMQMRRVPSAVIPPAERQEIKRKEGEKIEESNQSSEAGSLRTQRSEQSAEADSN